MNRQRTTLRVTLQVTPAGGYLLWSSGNGWQQILVTGDAAMEPTSWIDAAYQSLTTALAGKEPPTQVEKLLEKSRWRLVLPWGFYALSKQEVGTSRRVQHETACRELAATCPMPLDELIVASLPLGNGQMWIASLPESTLESWVNACDQRGVFCEGIWTSATALVEYLLEQERLAKTPFNWSDGRESVEVQAAAQDNSSESSSNDTGMSIRVRAAHGLASVFWAADKMWNPDAKLSDSLTVESWPAAAASLLERIDPSESLSLAREGFQATDLAARRQRPFAWSLAVLSLACLLWGTAAQIQASRDERLASAARTQIQQSYQAAVGPGAVSATPLASLDQQAAAWENLRQRISVSPEESPALEQLGTLLQQLPADLPVTVSGLRYRQKELWLDGAVGSQADARRLEEILGRIPHVKADPMRTVTADGGLVRYSIHLTL